MASEKAKDWGGLWTKVKLEVIDRYLEAYTKVMKNKRFKVWYIDGFAGDGQSPGDAAGSPLLALSYDRINRFVFIDKNRNNIESLKRTVHEKFSNKLDIIEFIKGDANEHIPRILDTWDKNRDRGVIFLDPFGLEISWKTIEAIAKTEAIDLWLLTVGSSFMLRLLSIDYERNSQAIIKTLERYLGVSEEYIKNYFYGKQLQLPLSMKELGNYNKNGAKLIRARMDQYSFIRKFVNLIQVQLSSLFPITIPPLVLCDKDSGQYKFMLHFFCANKNSRRARIIASDIAKYITHLMERKYPDVCFVLKI